MSPGLPDLSGRELLHEWKRLMDSLVSTAASVTGGAELPAQLLQPMQRQLELVQELIEREQRLQAELAERLTAPVDAAFDLLEQSAGTMRKQAETLRAAGRALEETARLMKGQAELLERTITAARHPTELAKAAIAGDPGRLKR